jgi:hypothetical protein
MQPMLRVLDGGLAGPNAGTRDCSRTVPMLTDDERTEAATALMELAARWCFRAPTLATCCRRLAIWVTKGTL